MDSIFLFAGNWLFEGCLQVKLLTVTKLLCMYLVGGWQRSAFPALCICLSCWFGGG